MIKIFCDGSMEVRYSQHPFWWGFCPWITWLSKQSTVPARRHALGVKCSPGFIGFKTDFFWDKMLRSYPLFEGSGTIKWPNASISLGKTELWRWCNFIRPYLSVATWIQSPVVSVVLSAAIFFILHFLHWRRSSSPPMQTDGRIQLESSDWATGKESENLTRTHRIGHFEYENQLPYLP